MRLKPPSLTNQILIAFVLGIGCGVFFPAFGQRLEILSTMFIRMVLMIIAPLVFSTLVVGIAGVSNAGTLGTLAVKSFLLFFLATGLSLAMGFGGAFLLRPGEGILGMVGEVERMALSVSAVPGQESFWLRLIPKSVVDAMARGDVLQIVFFSMFFGVALRAVGERGSDVVGFFRALTEIMFTFAGYVMLAAPIGVFGAAAAVMGKHGMGVLANFVLFAVSVLGGLALLVFILFPLLGVLAGVDVRTLARHSREAVVLAFATASSGVALPKGMAGLERFGVPRAIVAFVMSLGLSFNLTGTTLYIGSAIVFLVQAFHVPVMGWQWVELFVIFFIVSKGVPSVPRGSIVLLTMGLTSFGFPAEVIGTGVGILLSIDPILDMARTGSNMAGNCLITAVVARWQGEKETGTEGEGR